MIRKLILIDYEQLIYINLLSFAQSILQAN